LTEAELRRCAAGCVLAGFSGTTLPDGLRRALDGGLGGLTLFAHNIAGPEQLTRLTSELRSIRPDCLLSVDEEGGDVTRLEAGTGSSVPGNAALGFVDDPQQTRRIGSVLGTRLANAGIDLDLAPVADVNTNPQNPIIGVRAFGSDAARVARHVVAMVHGLQSSGVGACVKHFPGHGSSAVDSHRNVPTIGLSRDELASRELVPFRAAIAAGVQAVMVGHLRVPAYDDVPATVSSSLVHDLLRGQLGFGGLVLTDALEMRAVSDAYGIPGAAVRSLAAGADGLCLGARHGVPVLEETLRTVVEAVRSDLVAEQRIAEAAARVSAAVRRRPGEPPREATDGKIGASAARRAVYAEGAVRVGSGAAVVELCAEPTIAVGDVPWGLGAVLAGRDEAISITRLDRPPVDVGAVTAWTAGRPLVVVVRDLHRHDWQRAVVEELAAARPDLVLVEMGIPACRPGGLGGYLATHGAARISALAATDLLLEGPQAVMSG
jgi:beta-N-acetylhexosaminidase